jgi:hypothetical protein
MQMHQAGIGFGSRNLENYRLGLLLRCGKTMATSTGRINTTPPPTRQRVEPEREAMRGYW